MPVSPLARAETLIRDHRIEVVKVGGPDLEGVFRGKRIPAGQFLDHLTRGHGIAQCDCLFGWDIAENLIPGLGFTGWQTGFPDMVMDPDLTTLAVVPWEKATAVCVADFVRPDGGLVPVAPRTVMRRVMEKAAGLGYVPMAAAELEFRIYRETVQTLRAKTFRNLEPLSPGTSCYSIYRETTDEFLIGEIRAGMESAGFRVEGYNREHGPGMYEINLRYAPALQSADRTMLYKTGVKEICAARGFLASFMAKPFHTEDGMSCHTHVSLWEKSGTQNLFAEMAPQSGEMPDLMRWFLGGVMATAREFMACYAPTVNSYKRYVAGTWAPTNVTWGRDNRTAAFRVIAPRPGSEESRIENRIPGADANPYLAMAATVAAGLHGIANRIEPPAAVNGNAYDVPQDQARLLPRTLGEAAALFAESAVAREWFGDGFVKDFARTREWEWEQARRVVSEWERERYLEMI